MQGFFKSPNIWKSICLQPIISITETYLKTQDWKAVRNAAWSHWRKLDRKYSGISITLQKSRRKKIKPKKLHVTTYKHTKIKQKLKQTKQKIPKNFWWKVHQVSQASEGERHEPVFWFCRSLNSNHTGIQMWLYIQTTRRKNHIYVLLFRVLV